MKNIWKIAEKIIVDIRQQQQHTSTTIMLKKLTFFFCFDNQKSIIKQIEDDESFVIPDITCCYSRTHTHTCYMRSSFEWFWERPFISYLFLQPFFFSFVNLSFHHNHEIPLQLSLFFLSLYSELILCILEMQIFFFESLNVGYVYLSLGWCIIIKKTEFHFIRNHFFSRLKETTTKIIIFFYSIICHNE